MTHATSAIGYKFIYKYKQIITSYHWSRLITSKAYGLEGFTLDS